MVAYIASENVITIILNGTHKMIQIKTKKQRNEIISAIETYKKSNQTEQDLEKLEKYLVPIKRINLESDGRLELDTETNELYLKGTDKPIENGLANKILDFLNNNLPIEALITFWESCLKNPHYIAIKELFEFLEKNNLPITDDGGFLGYKKLNLKHLNSVPQEFTTLYVNNSNKVVSLNGKQVSPEVAEQFLNYVKEENNPTMLDVYSGTITQKIGDEVQIQRIKFNEEEARNACGYGLHIGSFDYAFSGNVRVLVKVFPEDVIASDPSNSKLRTCKYKIVSFVDSKEELTKLLIKLNEEDQEDYDDSYDEDYDDQDVFDPNPFSVGDIVVANNFELGDDVESAGLTEGNIYYVTNTFEDYEYGDHKITIVNDLGEEQEYLYNYFELK